MNFDEMLDRVDNCCGNDCYFILEIDMNGYLLIYLILFILALAFNRGAHK